MTRVDAAQAVRIAREAARPAAASQRRGPVLVDGTWVIRFVTVREPVSGSVFSPFDDSVRFHEVFVDAASGTLLQDVDPSVRVKTMELLGPPWIEPERRPAVFDEDACVEFDLAVPYVVRELLGTDEAPYLAPLLELGASEEAAASARSAYAEWLRARADPRAELLLLALRLAVVGANAPETDRDRLAELVARSDDERPGWWSLVKPAALVLNCGAAVARSPAIRFAFECPMTWAQLKPSDDPRVRHCGECAQPVTWCASEGEAEVQARAGACIAVPLRLTGRYSDDMRHKVGRPEHPIRRWARSLFDEG